MARPRLTKLELRIMEALWTRGACSVREIQETFPEKGRPAFTTVQTIVYRLESKGAVRIVKKVGNANIFEAVTERSTAENRLIDDLLGLFSGRIKPVIARLVETGKLTMEDVRDAEDALRKLAEDESPAAKPAERSHRRKDKK